MWAWLCSAGKWLISKGKLAEAVVAILAWLSHKQFILKSGENTAVQGPNWKLQQGNILISSDTKRLMACLLKQCLVYICTCNSFRFRATVFDSTFKLCWGWTVWGYAHTFYSQSIMKIVRWIQMHLHTDNMARFAFKCTDGSGYVQEQQQFPSEHTATLSPRGFITDLDYPV